MPKFDDAPRPKMARSPCPQRLLWLWVLLGAACRTPLDERLVVHGAASLTEPLGAVASTCAGADAAVMLSLGASSHLARQLEAGAPGDVFISADEAWMDALQQQDALRPGTRRALLTNRMVVVVPADASFVPRTLGELSNDGVERIGVAGHNVPAGRYADAVLRTAGLQESLERKIVRGTSVRSVLAWVARHEVDAGFVYATDAHVDDGVHLAFDIPDALQPRIVYSIAVLAHSRRPEAAERFVEACSGARARTVFEAAGFRMLPLEGE